MLGDLVIVVLLLSPKFLGHFLYNDFICIISTASKVTTLWRDRNMCIIIIIINQTLFWTAIIVN